MKTPIPDLNRMIEERRRTSLAALKRCQDTFDWGDDEKHAEALDALWTETLMLGVLVGDLAAALPEVRDAH